MSVAIPESTPTILFEIAKIIVPDDRQRQAAVADAELIGSIELRGLIQPIVLQQASNGMATLIAGERRLDAHRKLKLTHIRASLLEELPAMVAFAIELEENIKRKQLCWQDECRSVGRYHAMKLNAYAGWTQMGTATDLNISQSHLSRILQVAEDLADEEISSCPTLMGAYNLLTGRAERALMAAQSRGIEVAGATSFILPPVHNPLATKAERNQALLASIDITKTANATVDDLDKSIANIQAGKLAAAALAMEREREVSNDFVINADFLDWAVDYTGPKFDVIHCDFPYGKGFSGSNTRRTGKAHINPLYADNPDIYFGLVDGFLNLQNNIMFPAAHCMFWFDMMYYQWTVDRFEEAGWKLVQPFPLIWTKGYTGVASDPRRRPRHCYETALLFSRGDRKIVKLDNDHIDCPLDDVKAHMSQKPQPMLRKFLGLVVDEHTAMLDPTCGSGSSLIAARQLKAARVLGVEIDNSHAEVARFLLASKAPVVAEEKADV